jgi:hypothetical protein
MHVCLPIKVCHFCTVHSLEPQYFRFVTIFLFSFKTSEINGFTLFNLNSVEQQCNDLFKGTHARDLTPQFFCINQVYIVQIACKYINFVFNCELVPLFDFFGTQCCLRQS